MSRIEDMTVVPLYWCDRFYAGQRVVMDKPESDRSPQAKGLLGTVVKCAIRGVYAGDRYVHFHTVTVDFDTKGTAYVSEWELSPAPADAPAPQAPSAAGAS